MNDAIIECSFINIEDIDLDYENPRIARIIEIFPNIKDISAEQISLALGTDGSDSSHTTFNSLKESIRTNGGIIHPIIVNRVDKRYVVIEGNTRVQIYKDFSKKGVSGQWERILAVVYENLPEQTIHAIRLQSHLVGPRDWDPYSKAKYLCYLYNEEKLPLSQIVDFCGGDKIKTLKYIKAYELMEEHYRTQLDSDNDFDAEKFSAFIEYQNSKVSHAINENGYTIDDFAEWIISEKIPQLSKIRQLPMVLGNPRAKNAFISGTIDDGIKILDVISTSVISLKDATLDQLVIEISRRIREIPFDLVKKYRTSEDFSDGKAHIYEAYDQLKELCDDISNE